VQGCHQLGLGPSRWAGAEAAADAGCAGGAGLGAGRAGAGAGAVGVGQVAPAYALRHRPDADDCGRWEGGRDDDLVAARVGQGAEEADRLGEGDG